MRLRRSGHRNSRQRADTSPYSAEPDWLQPPASARCLPAGCYEEEWLSNQEPWVLSFVPLPVGHQVSIGLAAATTSKAARMHFEMISQMVRGGLLSRPLLSTSALQPPRSPQAISARYQS